MTPFLMSFARPGLRCMAVSLLFLLSASLCCLEVAAQTVADDPGQTQNDPAPRSVVFETATVRARALSTAGSPIEILDSADIERRVVSDLAQLLRRSPGVFAVSGARSTQTPLQLRGGDPNFALVLLDGVPLNDSTDSLGGAVDASTIALSGVARVETVRGSSSWFYGSSALSGVIQLITREPGELGYSVEAAAGNAQQLTAAAGFESRLGSSASFGLRLGHDEEEGRVFDAPGKSDRFEQDHGLLRLHAQPRDSVQIRGSLRAAQTDKADWGEGSGGPLSGSGELRFTDQTQLGASLLVDFGKTLYQQFLLTRSDQDVERISPAIFPVVPRSSEDTHYRHTRAAWRLQAPVASWLLGGGAEAVLEEGENQSLLLLPDFLGGPLSGDYNTDRDQGAVFVEAIHQSTDREGGLTIELGGRLDLTEDSSDQFSPHFGVSYRPRASEGGASPFRLRASVGRSFKLPSFYALSSPPALGGNPALEPETATGGDIGVELDLADGDLSLGIGIFATRYQDLIDFDFETFRLINRSEVDARGVEARLRWSVSKAVSLDINATAQQVEDAAGVDLLRRPSWYGGARLHWRFDLFRDLPLDLLAELELVGDSDDEQVPVGRGNLDGYELFNLAGTWSFTDAVGLRLRIDNLFDESYQTQLGFPGPGVSFIAGVRFER